MILRALLGAALALCAGTAGAAGATGSLVGVQPLAEDESWIVETIAPGRSASAAAVLVNLGDVPRSVVLGTADGVTTPDGVFTLAGADEVPVDVGAWITAPVGRVTLAPRERRIIRFRIRVPAGATPGDHAGGLVVQSASAAQASTGDGLAVRVVERVGLRVYVTVTGERDETLAVEGLAAGTRTAGGLREAVGLPGAIDVAFTVRHRGNVRFDALRGVVELRSGGDVVHSAPLDLGTLLPRDSRRVEMSLPLSGWSPRAYEVSVRLADATGAQAATRVHVDPVRPMATGGLLLAVVGTGVWSRRRRAR